MKTTTNKPLLRKLVSDSPNWFSGGNKRFFGDRQYFGMYGGKTGNPYLVRSTYAWSDMFGQPKTLTYRVNKIRDENGTYTIGSLLDTVYATLSEVKQALQHEGGIL